jgi:Zn-dependent protease with chaperone function
MRSCRCPSNTFLLGVVTAIGLLAPPAARAAFPEDQAAPAPDTSSAVRPVEVPPPSEKAVRYFRGNNLIWGVEQILSLLLPVLLLFTGLSARMRTLASNIGHGHFYPTLVVYLVLFSLLMFVVQLPLDYFVGFAREHAYGLSSQKLSKWATDQLKGLGVGLVVGALVLWVPYWLLGRSPQRWWLWTGMLALPFYMLTLFVVPLWIAPLFNKFSPMKDKALEAEVLATAQKAGVEGARVFEVEKSVDTNKVNAYVTGIGGTKRIVLWDTLLKKLEPGQIKFVVGHELGHYVLGHIWTSILLSSLLTILGLFGAHRLSSYLLGHFGTRLGFTSLADVASLPLLMLLLSLFSLVVTPAMLAFSRYHEHAADRFALDLTHDNHDAATAFVALQQQNLAVPRPGALYKLFRASHPPIGERVDFINSYHPWTGSKDDAR